MPQVFFCAPNTVETLTRFARLFMESVFADDIRYDAAVNALRDGGITPQAKQMCMGLHRELYDDALPNFTDALSAGIVASDDVLTAIARVAESTLKRHALQVYTPHLADSDLRLVMSCERGATVENFARCEQRRLHLAMCVDCKRRLSILNCVSVEVF